MLSSQASLLSQHASEATEQTILIVEDDQDIGVMVATLLELETPYQTRLAQDGQEALTLARDTPPSLLVLDYQLPGINGVQLYDRLRTLPGLEHVPAVLMSANLPVEEMKKRHMVGLCKPFDVNELIETVKHSL
jgi:two-component system, response regulator, stage 0 sporulation protein F